MARILCAEDDADIAHLIALRLSTVDGHEVTTVTNGETALDLCRRDRPDLVLLDVLMPGPVDGLDVLRAIRADSALAGTPVILLTALAHKHQISAGLEAGADMYLTKPFSPRDLADRVAWLLGERRTRSASEPQIRPLA